MTSYLKPYPAYKDSGLPWLGQVPGHWEVRRLKTVFRETDRRSTDGEGTLLSLTRVRGLIPHREMTDRMHSAKTLVGYKCYRAGQLVMNRMQAWSGMFGAGPTEGLVSPDYAVFDVLGDHSIKFLLDRLRAPDLVGQFALESKGIGSGFNRLYTDRFGPIPIPLPPPSEQAAIVRFLDWANGRLERAIRAKRKVIALLNEQKQAIIHQAVTRGLDPSVPLKDSGVPWLGEIPKHWEVRRLKSLSRFVTSGSRGWARYYADAGSVFLRIGNISTTSVDLRLKRIFYVLPPAGAEGERTRAIPNDVLVSITAQIGAVGVVPDGLGEAFVNQHTALIRLRPQRVVPRWAAYGLLSQFGKDQCRLMTNGGTKIGLTLDDVRCLLVTLPPVEEQLKLVAGIEDRTREQDFAISRLEREITLLREYRTRLVADVVTGKLDVREAAERLPAEEAIDTSEDAAEFIDEVETIDEEIAE